MARVLLAFMLFVGTAVAEDTHALLVGCTEYPNLKSRRGYDAWIKLYGPENDVALMRETLVRYLGVDKTRITSLAGWPTDVAARPTRANIVGHLKRLAREVRKGDRVIVHFAGHGSQQPDESGDEPDGLDEILLPADIGMWNGKKRAVKNSITDDEMDALLAPIRRKGAFVWLIADCCHAGTIARAPGDEIRTRGIPREILGVPGVRGASKNPAPDFANLVAFYAVEAHDKAPEMPLPRGDPERKYHGLLTWHVAAQLQRTGGALTYRELHARVLAAFRDHPRIRALPQIEGEIDRSIHGAGVAPTLLVTRRGKELVAGAGRLHGLRKGAVLELRNDAGTALGRVRVRSAGVTESIVEAAGDVMPFDVARAEIAEQPLDDLRLKVSVVGGAASALPTGPQWTYVADKDAEWRIVVRPDKSLALEPVGGAGARYELRADEITQRLRQVFRWQALRRLASGRLVPALPRDLAVEMLVDGKPMEPGTTLHPGGTFKVRLRNDSKRAMDVTVLVLDADCGTVPLIETTLRAPRERGNHASDSAVRGPFDIHDQTQGVEHLLVLAVPRAPDAEPTFFGWFAQGGLPRTERGSGSAHRLRDLLATMQEGGPTRGTVPAGEAYAKLVTWRTAWPLTTRPRDFGSTPALVPSPGACMRALTATDGRAWQPAASRTRLRDGTGVYAKAATSVVVVRTRTGHGTGFLVAPRLVLTNRHVIGEGYTTSPAGRPRVTVHRGDADKEGWVKLRAQGASAEVVAWDEARDLALLELPAAWSKGMRPIDLAPGGPKPGQEIFLIGHPASGLLWSLRSGRAAGDGRMPHDVVDRVVAVLNVAEGQRAAVRAMLSRRPGVHIILGDIGANPGDSGSPLLDAEGRLLGVTYAIPRDVRTDKFAYHVHRDEAQAFLARPRAAGPLVPDAWDLGPNVAMAGADVLVAGAGKPEQVLLDIDGEAGAGGAIEDVVRLKSFDAEAAFHFAEGRRTAFYDSDNDGTFDLVLVDEDDDPDADVSFKLVGATWVVRTNISLPWLGSGYLRFDGGPEKARAKFKKVLHGS